MSDSAIQKGAAPSENDPRDLAAELEAARESLVIAEAALGEEQATINAFRMQVRLKLGLLLDEVLELHARMQSVLTEERLREAAAAAGVTFDPADPFGWHDEVALAGDDVVNEVVQEEGLPSLPAPSRDRAAEKRLFRELARRFHPDLGGGDAERAYRTSIMAAVNEAYANNDVQTLWDLAGQQDPESVLHDSANLLPSQRRLHKRLVACNRRRRKVLRQLQALRQETSARLWRRAMVIEASGLNWWEEVAQELQQESRRLRLELERFEEEPIEQE